MILYAYVRVNIACDFFDSYGRSVNSSNENEKEMFWQWMEKRLFLSQGLLNFKIPKRVANGETWGKHGRSLATGNCIAKLHAKIPSLIRGRFSKNSRYCLPVRFQLKHELFLHRRTKIFSVRVRNKLSREN